MLGHALKTLHTTAALAATGVVLHVAGDASAAAPPPRTTAAERSTTHYEIVDPGHADLSGAAHQLRVFPEDLSPHGMQRTYRVPGRDDLLMRTNGALFAIFDESQYKRDPTVKNATVWRHAVPAATVFYIGRPDFSSLRSTGIRMINLRQADRTQALLRESQALESIPGVERIDATNIASLYEQGPKRRLERRLDLKTPEGQVPAEDISLPPVRQPTPEDHARAERMKELTQRVAEAMRAAGKGDQVAVEAQAQEPAAATPSAASRPERPDLGERVARLMRQAAKDS